MEILDNKALLLVVRNPDRFTSIIEKSKYLGEVGEGLHEIVVKWDHENVDALTRGVVGIHHITRWRAHIGTRQGALHTAHVQTSLTHACRVQVHLNGSAWTADGLHFACALDLLQIHFQNMHCVQLLNKPYYKHLLFVHLLS